MDENESIKYPVDIYGDVQHATQISVDIGGSLVKISYLVKLKQQETNEEKFQLRFVKFETKYIEKCLDFIQKYLISSMGLSANVIYATGGGSQKYKDLIARKLGVDVQSESEIDCVIKGCIFLMYNVKNETFTVDPEILPSFVYKTTYTDHEFPFLLVNIGSGVSMIKVDSHDKYERVGGTGIGGGTFWGLGSLLTDIDNYEELISMACQGDAANVDMLVKDIYGKNYEILKLPGNLTASYFGKCFKSHNDKNMYDKRNFNPNDLARSLLQMIIVNISNISVLHAKIHNLRRIYFSGYFISNNPIPTLGLSKAISYFSEGKMVAVFFKHVGFLGSLGAFHSGVMKQKQQTGDIADFHSQSPSALGIYEQNVATSSFDDYKVSSNTHPIKIISFDYTHMSFSRFPLLISGGVITSSIEKTLKLACYFERWVDCFVDEFKSHQDASNQCDGMCDNFKRMILTRLNCYKSMDYRSLLENFDDIWQIPDIFVKQFLVVDPFLSFKHDQNQIALRECQSYFAHLESLPDILARFRNIFLNLLAGNLVDFSSSEFIEYKRKCNQLSQCEMIKEVTKGFNVCSKDFVSFIQRFSDKTWKKVVIFANKSGYDLIFGVFAIAREFLKRGIHVVLAANSYPSFSDVVYSELVLIFERIKNVCPILKNCSENQLTLVETGQSSSYLNMCSTTTTLCNAASDVDLIIIDGLSRSAISQFNTKFSCDVLYVGSITSLPLCDIYSLKMFETYLRLDSPC